MKIRGIEVFLLLTIGIVIGFIFMPEFALLCGLVLIYLIFDAVMNKIQESRIKSEKFSIIPKYHPDYKLFS